MGWKFWEKTEQPPVVEDPAVKASDEAYFSSQHELSKTEIEGYGPRSSSQRTVNTYKAMGEGDMRRVISNINDLQGLDQRFAKYFDEATLHMERRKAEESKLTKRAVALVYEDLSKDRVYQHYQAEQEALEKRINMHWVDKTFDRAEIALRYSLRVWTTVGLMMGAGRTMYLWRTMDKRYAKLHGVSLPSIAMFELSLHCMKGAAAGFAGTFALAFGDSVPHMVQAMYTRNPVYGSREWNNVMFAGSAWGLVSCAVFSGTNYKYFGVPGIFKFTAAGTLAFTAVGYYVGTRIYHPFVSKLEHRYDDPYWRPWHLRIMQRDGGGRFSKGRYL